MKKKEPYKEEFDDIRVLIAEAKIRNNLNEVELSRCLGIAPTTLASYKNNPAAMSIHHLFIILELCEKEIQYVEKRRR